MYIERITAKNHYISPPVLSILAVKRLWGTKSTVLLHSSGKNECTSHKGMLVLFTCWCFENLFINSPALQHEVGGNCLIQWGSAALSCLIRPMRLSRLQTSNTTEAPPLTPTMCPAASKRKLIFSTCATSATLILPNQPADIQLHEYLKTLLLIRALTCSYTNAH